MKKTIILLIISLFCFYCDKGLLIKQSFAADDTNTFTVFVDKLFNEQQETFIFEAIMAWEKASSHKIHIVPYFRATRPGKIEDFYKKTYKDNSVFIWNISEKELNNDMRISFNAFAGVWDSKGNILIFKDVIDFKPPQESRFYNVTLHELGHMLGLEHFNQYYKTVMHYMAQSSCVTDIDASLLCEKYNCVPKPECKAVYFDSNSP